MATEEERHPPIQTRTTMVVPKGSTRFLVECSPCCWTTCPFPGLVLVAHRIPCCLLLSLVLVAPSVPGLILVAPSVPGLILVVPSVPGLVLVVPSVPCWFLP